MTTYARMTTLALGDASYNIVIELITVPPPWNASLLAACIDVTAVSPLVQVGMARDGGGNFAFPSVTFVPLQQMQRARSIGCSINSPASITGSISGTTLTVTAVSTGVLHSGTGVGSGSLLTGSGVTANTQIQSQLTGSLGGTGTYRLSLASGTVGGEAMTALLGAVYDALGPRYDFMLSIANYIQMFGAFPNSAGNLDWVAQSGVIRFTSTLQFMFVVQAIANWIAAWQQFVDGQASAPTLPITLGY